MDAVEFRAWGKAYALTQKRPRTIQPGARETKPKWISKHVLLPRIRDCCHHPICTGDPPGRARVATRDRGLGARAQNASREGLDYVGQGGRATDRGERPTRRARVEA